MKLGSVSADDQRHRKQESQCQKFPDKVSFNSVGSVQIKLNETIFTYWYARTTTFLKLCETFDTKHGIKVGCVGMKGHASETPPAPSWHLSSEWPRATWLFES